MIIEFYNNKALFTNARRKRQCNNDNCTGYSEILNKLRKGIEIRKL
jgi:hypothetical protein